MGLSYGGYLEAEITSKNYLKVEEYIKERKQHSTFLRGIEDLHEQWGLKVTFSPADDEGYVKVTVSNVEATANMDKAYFLSAEARSLEDALWTMHYKCFVMKPYSKAPEVRSRERGQFR